MLNALLYQPNKNPKMIEKMSVEVRKVRHRRAES